ncbi:1,4-dihydroxy-2-naphthoate polyprenyltransferase [Paenibacillus camelliae]|uniref:1,4-dihydroxy-2-naphthoate polyprenyltransferase n=1 Tax=Paenibacillus camelliae TaxID=512410 RepID=UPI00203E2D52|nr:1,4-dihydroxy-2-naphthoate polyprenyltransferase [Paenibacillus camelliae]MCM3635605.1 1,4-dihydroxy-2-naphthoate polyprenyltransferase [Paenibacillus camelliae]
MQTQLQAANSNVWWRLMRPHTLTASFVPVFTGTAMALYDGSVQLILFMLMLIASLLIQAATNMFNEYYDYVRGLDNENSVGIGGTIVRDGVAPKFVRNLAFLFYFISLLIGIYICYSSSWWIAVIGLLSMAVGYFYTAGPFPIAYTPFGELFSGLFMGPVIIMITYFIQTGDLNWSHLFVSISVGFLIGALNLSNNIRDMDGDKEHGRRTIAVLLGRPASIQLLGAIFAIAFAWIIVLVFMKHVTPWAMLVLISVPQAISAYKQFIGKTVAFEMMPAMKATGKLNTMFGVLLTFSFIIGYLVEQFL